MGSGGKGDLMGPIKRNAAISRLESQNSDLLDTIRDDVRVLIKEFQWLEKEYRKVIDHLQAIKDKYKLPSAPHGKGYIDDDIEHGFLVLNIQLQNTEKINIDFMEIAKEHLRSQGLDIP